MNDVMFCFWADHLNTLRDQDPRLDAVLDLGSLENALRAPGTVDVYGVATVYKARLLRRQVQLGASNAVIDDIMLVVDEVLALSTVA
jgi:hypothetical protein